MTFDEIIRCLSTEEQKIIKEMMVLYDEIDRQTSNFSGQTGLSCKAGCGACCENPEIETTVAEVLPLAAYLWSQGLASNKLEAIRLNSSKGVCVFYEPMNMKGTVPLNSLNCRGQSPSTGQGRCGIYAYRPGLCRLFGFAARRDKHGQPVLVTCRVIKDSQAQACQRTQEQLQKGLEAPLLASHAFAVSNIDPVHCLKLFPINQAIRLALEKIGFNLQKQNLTLPLK